MFSVSLVNLRALLCLVVLGALCACSTRPVVVQKGARDDGVWSLTGRLGISARRQHGSFTVDWQQDKDKYRIDLLGPLGVGVARVSGDADKVTLQLPRRAPLVADSPEQLLSEALGLDIPVTPLRYWVRGVPAPGPFQHTADGFRQQGWTVDYLAYEQGLPVKIRLTRPEVKMLMVVRRWTD